MFVCFYKMKIAYKTKRGIYYNGFVEEIVHSKKFKKYKGKINLIFTSPPFPLNKKKKYGNLNGEEYLKWLSDLAPILLDLLRMMRLEEHTSELQSTCNLVCRLLLEKKKI